MQTLTLTIGLPLILSYLFANLFSQKLITFVPVIYSLSVLWIYLFSVTDNYLLGLKLLLPIFFFIAIIGTFIKSKPLINKKLLLELNTPASLFFILISIWMYFHSSLMRFYEWDEFSHWGVAVKSIFYFNQIGPFVPIELTFPEYIPGLPLFASLIVKTNGIWDESLVYWSYQLFIISLISALLVKFTWKHWRQLILAIGILLLSFVLFYDSFQTIYADPILAILFGFVLALALSKEVVTVKSHLINFSALIIFLSLIKEIGIYFALIASAVLLINLVFSNTDNKFRFKHKVFKSFGEVLLVLTPLLLVQFLWSVTLKKQDVSGGRSVLSVLNNLFLTNDSLENQTYLNTVSTNFYSRVLYSPLTNFAGIPITTLQWIIIFSALLVVMSFSLRNSKLKYNLLKTLVIVIGAFVYLFLLLVLYLTVFVANEALSLASFERYASAFLAGMAIVISKFSIDSLLNSERNVGLSLLTSLWLFLLLLQATPERITSYVSNPNQKSDLIRNNFSGQSWLISEMALQEDSKVWIIAQHTVGFEFYFLQYELLPASVGKIPFSIGSSFGPEDLWTDSSYTVEKWSEALKSYDYVFINNATESFKLEFGSMFDDSSQLDRPGFFVVDKSLDKIHLIKVR